MQKKKSSKSSNVNLYRQKKPLVAKPLFVEEIEPVSVNRIPLPPGIKEALIARTSFEKQLKRLYHHDKLTVSINVDKDKKWILEVRGVDPIQDYFLEYEVIYIPSTLIYNPKVR